MSDKPFKPFASRSEARRHAFATPLQMAERNFQLEKRVKDLEAVLQCLKDSTDDPDSSIEAATVNELCAAALKIPVPQGTGNPDIDNAM